MMTDTTRQALREWTPDRLQAERTRMQNKRDEFNALAIGGNNDAAWHVRDCDDWLRAIDNELARRAAAEVQA